MTPIRIIITPPTLTVYFSTLRCFLKRSSRDAANKPTARNGITNPIVYSPISRKPFALVCEADAISSTLERAGPTQGVQAKLKVKPISRAVSGDIAILVTAKGSLRSRSITVIPPNTPSWYSPNSIISTPPIMEKRVDRDLCAVVAELSVRVARGGPAGKITDVNRQQGKYAGGKERKQSLQKDRQRRYAYVKIKIHTHR